MARRSDTFETVNLSQLKPPEDDIIHKEVNGVPIKIKVRVPYQEIFTVIKRAVVLVTDFDGYVSELTKNVVADLLYVATYTNINLERLYSSVIGEYEIYEMYDIIERSGILNAVNKAVYDSQRHFYYDTFNRTVSKSHNDTFNAPPSRWTYDNIIDNIDEWR